MYAPVYSNHVIPPINDSQTEAIVNPYTALCDCKLEHTGIKKLYTKN